MPRFTFDMLLAASIPVEADSPDAARAALVAKLECADTNFGAFDDGTPILGEVSLADDDAPTLAMIDGEDVDDNPFHPESPEGRAWDAGDRSPVTCMEDLIEKDATDRAADPVKAALLDCIGALSMCADQIHQMRGMFDDADGAIQDALDAAEDAEKKAREVLA